MVAECERVREAKPVVFLDYVQALTSDAADADERLAIKGIVGSLRHAANSHEVPLFAISSVNRTSYDKPATGLSCLGGSSAVEYCSAPWRSSASTAKGWSGAPTCHGPSGRSS